MQGMNSQHRKRNRRAKRGKDLSFQAMERLGLRNTLGDLDLLARKAEHDPRAAVVVAAIRKQYDERIEAMNARLRASDPQSGSKIT